MSICPGLTDEQLKQTNGCGSSAWFAKPFRLPKWLVGQKIHCACNTHDNAYSTLQRTLFDKKRADIELVYRIYDDAAQSTGIMRHIKNAAGYITEKALDTFASDVCWLIAQRTALKKLRRRK